MGFWGPHCTYEQSCRGPHEVFELEITTSLGNNLCDVARSKVGLQKEKKEKKRSSPLQHLRPLMRATNQVLSLHPVKLSPNEKKIYLVNLLLAYVQSFQSSSEKTVS